MASTFRTLFFTCFILFCSLNSSSTNADQANKISAILYQDAFLPCETRRSINLSVHQSAHNNKSPVDDQINLILWYRHESSVPFYTVDARSDLDSFDYEDVHSKRSTTGPHHKNDSRMEFDLRHVTPLLRIQNVTEEDEGLYQCRVEYASERTFITEIRLNVIGAPVSLQITDSKGNPLEGVIGPFNEFESIRLVCTAYGGHPKPRVVWFKQRGFYEEIVDDSYVFIPLNSSINGTLSTVANVLHFSRLDRNDYLVRYLCRASTQFYHPPLVQTITVDMNLFPVNVRIYSSQYPTSPSPPLIAGQIAEFGCRTDGSKPAANIEWFLDHQRIVIANTDNYPSYYTETGTTTNLADPPNISKAEQSNSSMVITPLPLSLSLLSSSSPSAGKFVSIVVSYQANSTLSVIKFIPHYTDNGRILSCHAWNPFIANSKIVDKLALDVKYAPHLTIGLGTKHDILAQTDLIDHFSGDNLSGRHNLSVSTGSSGKSFLVAEYSPLFELNCHIKANPWIDQVIWYVNGAAITPAITFVEPFYSSAISTSTFSAQFEASQRVQAQHQQPALYLTNHNQTLRIENVHRFHFGLYQCAARNAINISQSEMVELNVAYKPQCVQVNQTQFVDVPRNVPLQLACKVDANPVDKLIFHWSLSWPWPSKQNTTQMPLDQHEIIQTVLQTKQSISVLDVARAVEQFQGDDPDKPKRDQTDHQHQPSDHSTLYLQCDAENVAGRQELPCAFLLRIVDGPPQKVTNCTFTVERTNTTVENGNANNVTTPLVRVGCVPGHDGGKVQTFHLIGLLSSSSPSLNHSSTDKPWLWSWSTTEDSGQEQAPNDPDVRRESSIIELIQSIQSYSVQWNLSANEVAQFVLSNATVNQMYDLIIYADNLIGLSAPVLYPNLVLLTDHDSPSNANQLNVSSRQNWAYLRVKGLIVVLFLLLIMGLIGLAIRNYLFSHSLYDHGGHHSGAHSLDDVSSEANEAETMIPHQEQRHEVPQRTQHSNLANALTGSRVANRSEERLESEQNGCEQVEPNVESIESDHNSYCSIRLPNHQVQPGWLSTGHISRVKRFLNRFVPITSSHYRSYELTPCEAVHTGAPGPTDPPDQSIEPIRCPEQADVHSPNCEQECISSSGARPNGSNKLAPLLHWFRSGNSNNSPTRPRKAVSNLPSSALNERNANQTNKNVQLLYVFTMKL